MSFAIVQDSLDRPDREAMRRAFRKTSTLTSVDADILGNDAFGIIVRRKPFDAAIAIQAALAGEGIGTQVVSDAELPELPPTKFVKRLDCQPEGLVVFDPLGRSFTVEWGHILLIAAGQVSLSEFTQKTVEREQVSGRLGGGSLHFGGSIPVPHIHSETVRETRTQEQRVGRLLLEIILAKAVARFSIKVDDQAGALFSYLGDRKTGSLPGNFALLIQDLCRFAPHAAVNRGAHLTRENPGQLFPYPSKNAFFEEITWLLWRISKTGQ